jgi:uroporphyrinogen decarboxylase
MEGMVWPELMLYFRTRHGLEDEDEVLDFLDTDFRWTFMAYHGPQPRARQLDPMQGEGQGYSWKVAEGGPLAECGTVRDVLSWEWPDPAWWQPPPDIGAVRRRWPEHALVFCADWLPLFWGSCLAFGMEEALIKIITAPQVYDAFIQRQHEFYMDILSRGLEAAHGLCDICWLGDDFAGQQGMLINPDLWRRHIKPYLAEQVRLARQHDMAVLYHSCGSVLPVLHDLIGIGVNALLVFQTTAAGMDAESIAAEFGGRLAFYGGMDVQHLLSFGSPEEVECQVFANCQAFAECGGYVVANSHHRVDTINGDNVAAMCRAARTCHHR